MLGLSFEKLIVVALIAVFIIGPDRLPLYAGRLATLMRTLRGRSELAKARVKEELGDGFDVAEWKQLDPRQYDPRRIIRQALAETEPPNPVAETAVTPTEAPRPALPESSIARLMRTSRSRLDEAQTQQAEVAAPVDTASGAAVPAAREDQPLNA